jgi:hypothetical protein
MNEPAQKATGRRWLEWTPATQISGQPSRNETTKPSEPGFVGFVGPGLERTPKIPLEDVLKGRVIELYLSHGDSLFIVADEEDAARLGKPRGSTYTAAEVRLVVQIDDPVVVDEVYRCKRLLDGKIPKVERPRN